MGALGATAFKDNLIESNDLALSYKNIAVLDSVSLRICRGEAVGIMAPSGAGKSTLVRVLLGLEAPGGGKSALRIPSTEVGIAFQEDSLLPWLDVNENATLLNRLNHKPYVEGDFEGLLSQLELLPFRRHFPRALSTGMKQKVALCRLLLFQPTLYVIDEAFSNIDDWLRFALCDLLRERVIRHNASLLCITHNPTDALHLCDRIYIGTPRPLAMRSEFTSPLPPGRDAQIRFTLEFRQALEELRKCSARQ
jgi:ABC-type nitrate/sulfonate/bicarbonate transport system ATPase subunit